MAGSRPSSVAVAAYATVHARDELGRSDQGPRAAPLTRCAGAPDQNSSSGTLPKTADPAATSASSPTDGAGAQHAARADARTPADADLAHPQQVAVDPVAGEVDLGLDGAAVAETQQPGDRGDGVQVDVLADLGAEQPGVPGDVRRAREVERAELVGQPFRGPQPQVHLAPTRVVARTDAAQEQADPAAASSIRPGGVSTTSTARPSHHQETVGSPSSPRSVGRPGGQQQPGEPPRCRGHPQHRGRDDLTRLRLERRRRHGPVADGVLAVGQPVEVLGQVPDRRVVVDVPDGHVGVAAAQERDHLRGRQAAPSMVEEVVAGAGGGGTQHLAPERGDPRGRLVERVDGRRLLGRQRPGERVAVDLAGRLGRDVVDLRKPRHEGGRELLAQSRHRRREVELLAGHHVADEHLVTGGRTPDGRGGGVDTGKCEQGAVDLAQLDPAPAQLDLVVLSAAEEQAFRVVDHEVAAAVGPLPAEGRHGGVLLGVLDRVEVASQTDPADDELTRGPERHRYAVGVDDREIPAVQREADPDRPLLGESRPAGDDGGLGRAVGVPHLAPVADQSGRELGRAGLAAQDQQTHVSRGPRRATATPVSAPWTRP